MEARCIQASELGLPTELYNLNSPHTTHNSTTPSNTELTDLIMQSIQSIQSIQSYQNVFVASLQSALSTGHQGIDLMLGLLLTSVVYYLVQRGPSVARSLWTALLHYLWPSKIMTTGWKHVINIRDTTASDLQLSRLGIQRWSLGRHHFLIVHGAIHALTEAGVIQQSSKQSLMLMMADDSPKTARSRYLNTYLSVFPEGPISHLSMRFTFTRASKQKGTDKGASSQSADTDEEISIPDIHTGVDLEVCTNDMDKTLSFLEQCKLSEIDRCAPVAPKRIPFIYTQNNARAFIGAPFTSCKTFRSVFFSEKERLLNVVDQFTQRKGPWRAELERPWKLVILMHSMPGCGKTSILKALSNLTHRHLMVCNPSLCRSNQDLESLFTDSEINNNQSSIDHVPLTDRIIVMEDLDSSGCEWLLSRETKPLETPVVMMVDDSNTDKGRRGRSTAESTLDRLSKSFSGGPTFSGFLNVLDGIKELTGLIVVITTNRIEKFDSAFLRPGRVDYQLKLEGITGDCAVDMLKFLMGAKNVSDADAARLKLLLSAPGRVLPPCELQQHVQWGGSVSHILDRVEAWLKEPSVSHSNTRECNPEELARRQPIENRDTT